MPSKLPALNLRLSAAKKAELDKRAKRLGKAYQARLAAHGMYANPSRTAVYLWVLARGFDVLEAEMLQAKPAE